MDITRDHDSQPHRAHRNKRLSATVILLVVLATFLAFSQRNDAASLASTNEAEARYPDLPELPDFAERFPDLVTAEGCIQIGPAPDEVDCPATYELPPEEEERVREVYSSLRGFMGKGFQGPDAEVTGTVRVLEETVRVGADGRIHGLLRNEKASWIANAIVEGRIANGEGQLIPIGSGSALVHLVRPGEPVPFTVTPAVPVAAEDLHWHVSSQDGDPSNARDAEINIHWSLQPGQRPRFQDDFRGYREPESGPRPYALAGGITNLSTEDIARPRVVVAWEDSDGRIVHVAAVGVRPGRPERGALLETKGYALFTHMEARGRVANELVETVPMIWFTGDE